MIFSKRLLKSFTLKYGLQLSNMIYYSTFSKDKNVCNFILNASALGIFLLFYIKKNNNKHKHSS